VSELPGRLFDSVVDHAAERGLIANTDSDTLDRLERLIPADPDAELATPDTLRRLITNTMPFYGTRAIKGLRTFGEENVRRLGTALDRFWGELGFAEDH
jgi:hypothetical protein